MDLFLYFETKHSKKMEDEHTTRTNDTIILLVLVGAVGVTMVMLTLILIRLGTLDRRLRSFKPSPPIFQGGRSGVEFFYI